MGRSEKKPGSKYPLPVICGKCGNRSVVAYRSHDRALLYCEVCDSRIFAYYLDEKRQAAEQPPQHQDALIIRQVERDLLRQVGEAAAALYEYLRRYLRQYGYAPTLREMQAAFGWSSPTAARHHLRQLERVGLIERDFGEPRGIRLPHTA